MQKKTLLGLFAAFTTAGALVLTLNLTCPDPKSESPGKYPSNPAAKRLTKPVPQLRNVRAKSDPLPGTVQAHLSSNPRKADTFFASDAALETAFSQFDNWTSDFQNASPSEREPMISRGKKLAAEKRAAIKQLITMDPERALKKATPMVVRQSIPSEVSALLEERVSTRGFYGVLAVPEGSGLAPITRMVDTGSKQYQAYVYGRRLKHPSLENALLHGIAVDGVMAVAESPVRALEKGESIADRDVFESCPVSGESVEIAAETVSSDTSAVEIAGEVHLLCSGGHLSAVEDQQLMMEGGTTSKSPSAVTSPTWATGPKRLLYIRAAFSDKPTDPQSEASCYTMLDAVNNFMRENSAGKTYFLPSVVTPLVVLPNTEAYYISADIYKLRDDARAAAKALGYDYLQYDLDAVRYSGGPGQFSGAAYVGARGCWMKSSSAGTAAHEFGHNLGLSHANFWQTTSPSGIGPGSNLEYGHSYDVMGSSGGMGHFHSSHKFKLGWLGDSHVARALTPGLHRIFQHDAGYYQNGDRYALRVQKDNLREYWLDFRQQFTSNQTAMNGLFVQWGAWANSNGGGQLIDTTPSSTAGRTDAALVIGRTFSDTDAGIHITPLRKNGTVPESMNIMVQFNVPTSNLPPQGNLQASATTVATGGAVSFTMNAIDPDGDELAYHWDFNDGSIGSNSASIQKSWSSSGRYVVLCTVSDMRGGLYRENVVVNVGSAGTYTVSGVVTDSSGNPLPNVLIDNNSSSYYRSTYTKKDGSYALGNVRSGTYTLRAFSPGLTVLPSFSNPVSVSSSQTGRNFQGSNLPTVDVLVSDGFLSESGPDHGRIVFTRQGSTASSLTVRFTLGGIARYGSDYGLSGASGSSGIYSVTIPAGSSSAEVTFTVSNDSSSESDEDIQVNLYAESTYHIGSSSKVALKILDNDTSLNRLSVIASIPNAWEIGLGGEFTISRTGNVNNSLSVNIGKSGTAIAGTDYQTLPSSVVIPAGSAAVTIPVVPINDSLADGQKTLILTITSGSYLVGTPNSAQVHINDDENDIPKVSILALDGSASENGGDTGLLQFLRTGSTASALEVHYAIGGTALHGADYQTLPGKITIPAGASAANLSIVPISDSIDEVTQTVNLMLQSRTSYQIGNPRSATVSIANGGPILVPTISFATSASTAQETAASHSVTITRTDAGDTSSSVEWYVHGGTASGNGSAILDYMVSAGFLNFAPGETQKTVSIQIIDDSTLEPDETIELRLRNASGANLGTVSHTVTIIDNDQNALPVAANDNATVNEGEGVFIPVLANDADTDGPQPLNIVQLSTPGHGFAQISGSQIHYTPEPGFFGQDSFTYTVSDGLAQASANVTVTVNNTAQAMDLKAFGLTGSAVGEEGAGSSRVLANGQWELRGAGTGMLPVGDSFWFEQQSVSHTHFQVLTRLVDFPYNGDPAAAAGLMIRESLEPNARFIRLISDGSGTLRHGTRNEWPGTFVTTQDSWLLIERAGEVFRIATSQDGVTFNELATYQLPGLVGPVHVGLAVCSGEFSRARAIFESYEYIPFVTVNKVIYPVADAHISGISTNKNWNVGSIQLSGVSKLTGFVKFDLSGLPASNQITSAQLKLHVLDAGTNLPYQVRLTRVLDDGWGESTVTHTTQPTLGTSIGTFTPKKGSWAGKTVTGDVRTGVATDGLVSFHLSITSALADQSAALASRSNTNPKLRPFMVVTCRVPLEHVYFQEADLSGYVGQDLNPQHEILDGGATLRLKGNAWKKIPFHYNLSTNSVMELEFKSPVQGEIHAVGTDNASSGSSGRRFQLYGTETTGKQNFRNYTGTNWMRYEIPIGKYQTGKTTEIFFINDHDVSDPTAESYFRNVVIYEK